MSEVTGAARLYQGHRTNQVKGEYVREKREFPAGTIFEHLGFTTERVTEVARRVGTAGDVAIRPAVANGGLDSVVTVLPKGIPFSAYSINGPREIQGASALTAQRSPLT